MENQSKHDSQNVPDAVVLDTKPSVSKKIITDPKPMVTDGTKDEAEAAELRIKMEEAVREEIAKGNDGSVKHFKPVYTEYEQKLIARFLEYKKECIAKNEAAYNKKLKEAEAKNAMHDLKKHKNTNKKSSEECNSKASFSASNHYLFQVGNELLYSTKDEPSNGDSEDQLANPYKHKSRKLFGSEEIEQSEQCPGPYAMGMIVDMQSAISQMASTLFKIIRHITVSHFNVLLMAAAQAEMEEASYTEVLVLTPEEEAQGAWGYTPEPRIFNEFELIPDPKSTILVIGRFMDKSLIDDVFGTFGDMAYLYVGDRYAFITYECPEFVQVAMMETNGVIDMGVPMYLFSAVTFLKDGPERPDLMMEMAAYEIGMYRYGKRAS